MDCKLMSACTMMLVGLAGCSDYRESERSSDRYGSTSGSSRDWPMNAAEDTTRQFKGRDPSLDRFFSTSYGYVVFPKITKGAAGIGAAHGDDGVVYEQGNVIGYAEVTQVNIGAQLGGQQFSEIIFFQDRAALEEFKRNNTEFAGNASAVAARSGAASAADFSNGVAIFTMPLGGLMFEASVGGQKFRYYPSR